MTWDLNCDLGEGESPRRTAILMKSITSANVACGGHAGDVESMRRCSGLARQRGVRLGAHPGPWDRKNFGRAPVSITPRELELLMVQQVGALELIAREEGIRLHHVKLHGGLYHAVEASDRLAEAYVECVISHWPRLKIYARAGGAVHRVGKHLGAVVWGEAFVDRGYLVDGGLVPRTSDGALIEKAGAVRDRLTDLCKHRRVTSMGGTALPMDWRTLCVHGDTPAAPAVARWAREFLER
ncbi:MAG: LamB/YcsF family protein [Verrucomicrobiales bacterium]|nr:LamB/YcsF family protein [Verrucomicrobiales bacterium]